MQHNASSGRCWTTSSFGDTADTTPMELSALGEHLDVCRALTGPLFALRCGAEAVHAFAATRVVTTLFAATVLISVGWLAS